MKFIGEVEEIGKNGVLNIVMIKAYSPKDQPYLMLHCEKPDEVGFGDMVEVTVTVRRVPLSSEQQKSLDEVLGGRNAAIEPSEISAPALNEMKPWERL